MLVYIYIHIYILLLLLLEHDNRNCIIIWSLTYLTWVAELAHPWLIWWPVACSVPSHYLNRSSICHMSVMRSQITGDQKCLCNSFFRPNITETSKFRITGPLWRESTCDRWIPLTKGPVMRILFPFQDIIIWWFLISHTRGKDFNE